MKIFERNQYSVPIIPQSKDVLTKIQIKLNKAKLLIQTNDILLQQAKLLLEQDLNPKQSQNLLKIVASNRRRVIRLTLSFEKDKILLYKLLELDNFDPARNLSPPKLLPILNLSPFDLI